MVGDAMDEHVASKTDIADLRSGLRNEISGLRNEMHSEIAGLRADMYLQLWFMATGIVAVTVALVKLIP